MGYERERRNQDYSRLDHARSANVWEIRFVAIPAALLALATLSGCKPDNKYVAPPAPTVSVARPEARNVTRYYETSGTVSSVNQADLVARVQGFLQAQNYTDGQAVTKGTVLFVIEPQPYQAKLAQSQAQAQAVQAQLTQAEAEYNRNASLAKNNFASGSTIDQSRAARDADRANLASAQADAQVAEINLSYTQVTAPFDGIVTAHQVSVGSLVGASGPTKLATIVQLDPIYVTFNASDQELQRLRTALAARNITREQLGSIPVEVGLQTETGYPHTGKIDYVAPLVDNTTGTVAVRAVLENGNRTLPPGGFVRVRVPLEREVSSLLVPEVAIGRDQAGNYVLTVGTDGIVNQKRVTLGISDGNMRVIATGVMADDQVVIAGLQRAVPGEKVQPRTQTASATP
jgi:RND family efflux transporter MFP subunit